MSDLVRVYSSGDAFATGLMKTRLEVEGISVLMKGGSDDLAYPAGPSYLFVVVEDETRARAVIDAVGSGAFTVEDDVEEREAAQDQPANAGDDA